MHEPLELGRRPPGDDPAAVEQRDPVGQPVGLFEVLRRQEDRHTVGDQPSDHVPHHPAAPGIESGRRLVQEDDPRVAHEGHREVEPPAHPARVGHRGPACVGHEVEPLEQLRDSTLARLAPEVEEIRHQPQVLLAGELAVDRGDLARQGDRVPHLVALASDVETGHPRLACVGRDQRGEDVDRRRLAGTVGPEQGEHRSGGDVEVDPVEGDLLAVGLLEAAGLDGERGLRLRRSCGHLPGWPGGAPAQISSSSTVGRRAERATMS